MDSFDNGIPETTEYGKHRTCYSRYTNPKSLQQFTDNKCYQTDEKNRHKDIGRRSTSSCKFKIILWQSLMIECSICMIPLLHSLRRLPFYPFILLHTILFECFSLTSCILSYLNAFLSLSFLGSNILAKQECIICRKKKTSPKGSGYEKLTKCVTAGCAMAIINYVNSINDSYGKTQLMDYPAAVVIAKEFQYHRTC